MFDHFTAFGQPGQYQYKQHSPISDMPEIIAIFNGICSPADLSTRVVTSQSTSCANAVKLTSQSLKLYLRGNYYAAI